MCRYNWPWSRALLLSCLIIVGGCINCSFPAAQTVSAAPHTYTTRQQRVHVYVSLQPTPALDALAFPDALHGWAAGNHVILATSDGGAHWFAQYQGPLDITSIAFTDRRHGIALAQTAVLVTSDGGARWLRLQQPASGKLISVDLVTSTVAFGVARSGPLETLDAGHTWIALPKLPGLREICFTDRHHGWAGVFTGPATGAGMSGGTTIFRTTDGGNTWRRTFVPPTGIVTQLQCSGDSAWIVLASEGPYSVYRTSDSGRSWQRVIATSTAMGGSAPGAPVQHTGLGIGPMLNSPGPTAGPLTLVGSREAYIVGVCPNCGDGGTLQISSTLDGGRIWRLQPGIAAANASGPLAIVFHRLGRGWLLADLSSSPTHAVILSSRNGGKSWTELYPAYARPVPVTAVSFVSPAVGFGLGTLGNGSAIVTTTDGGRYWHHVGELPLTAAPAGQAGALSFSSIHYGWALSPHGTLFTTDNGGVTWRPVPLPSSVNAAGATLFRLSAMTGCISLLYGSAGRSTLCTTDAGRRWLSGPPAETPWAAAAALKAMPLARRLAAHYPHIGQPLVGGATGATAAWLASYLSLYSTADAGKTWTQYVWPTGGPGLTITFVDANHGWLLSGGAVLATIDGGTTWHEVSSVW